MSNKILPKNCTGGKEIPVLVAIAAESKAAITEWSLTWRTAFAPRELYLCVLFLTTWISNQHEKYQLAFSLIENRFTVSLSLILWLNLLNKYFKRLWIYGSPVTVGLFISPLSTFPRRSTMSQSSVGSHVWQIVLYNSVGTLLPLLVFAAAHFMLTNICKGALSLRVWKLAFVPGHCYDIIILLITSKRHNFKAEVVLKCFSDLGHY